MFNIVTISLKDRRKIDITYSYNFFIKTSFNTLILYLNIYIKRFKKLINNLNNDKNLTFKLIVTFTTIRYLINKRFKNSHKKQSKI